MSTHVTGNICQHKLSGKTRNVVDIALRGTCTHHVLQKVSKFEVDVNDWLQHDAFISMMQTQGFDVLANVEDEDPAFVLQAVINPTVSLEPHVYIQHPKNGLAPTLTMNQDHHM